MALTTPVAESPKIAFDATQSNLFSFSVTTGDQVVQNKLTIRLNSDNSIVYENTTISGYTAQNQLVPANTLTNGTYYNYFFTTYNGVEGEFANSNVVSFYCYTSPTITFTNAPSNNIINSASYTFNIQYNQVEGETLDYLVYSLYNSNNERIKISSQKYNPNTPPVDFTETFEGFINGATYRVQVDAVSDNGTITTNSYTFIADYEQRNINSLIDLTNMCNNGYNSIKSNLIIIEGYVNEEPAIYQSEIPSDGNFIKWGEWYTVPETNKISEWTERVRLDLRGTDKEFYVTLPLQEEQMYTIEDGALANANVSSIYYTTSNKIVTFDKGFSIPSSHQLLFHGRTSMDGEIFSYYKEGNESNKIIISMKSGIPSGETTVKNWCEIKTQDGNLFDYTNYIDALNEDTDYIVFLNKIENSYTFTLQSIDSYETEGDLDEYLEGELDGYLEGELDGGIDNGVPIHWNNDSTYPTTKIHNNIDFLFPLDTITLKNGVYDLLDLSRNTNRPYELGTPIWDYYTIMQANFDGDLRASNTDLILSQLQKVDIKRRLSDAFDWITIHSVPVTTTESLNITYNDYFAPSNTKFDYAIVPVTAGGIEGDYIIDSLETDYKWAYLTDGVNTIQFESNVSFESQSNPQGTVIQPIGRKFPIIIYNSDEDFENGTFSGDVLNANFLSTHKFDGHGASTRAMTYKQFINNKRPKILKDWYGRIKLVNTNVGAQTSESVDMKTGKTTLTFGWVEIGDWNSQEYLTDNGLI